MADPRPPREGAGAFVEVIKRQERKIRELSAPSGVQRAASGLATDGGGVGARVMELERAVADLRTTVASLTRGGLSATGRKG